MMFLGQICVDNLKIVSLNMWNSPLESEGPWTFNAGVVGEIKSYHLFSVRGFYLMYTCTHFWGGLVVNIGFKAAERG